MRNSALLTFLFLAAAMTTCRSDEQVVEKFTVHLVSSRTETSRWVRAASLGLDRIASELEAEVERLEVGDPEDARAVLVEQGRSGVDLVFCVGAGAQKILPVEASAYPKTAFVVIPGNLSTANVGGIRFLPEEAGYIAGAVAGSMSPNRKVGVLHGQGQTWLEQLEEGFLAGYQSRRRRVVVESAEGFEGAKALWESGVAIALYASDRTSPEILDAADEVGLKLVGADMGLMAEKPETVVAAIKVDVAEAMLRVAREVRDGTFTGQVFAFDLGSGVLDVVVSEGLEPDVRASAQEVLDEARSEVTAGLVEFDELGL